MLLPVAWAHGWRAVAVLASLGPVMGGCGAQGAEDAPSLVAIVPPAPVIVHAETFVTQIHAAPPRDLDVPVSVPVPAPVAPVRPPDPGCVPDDTACLEAACTRGSGHGCEARGDLYQRAEDLRALAFYGRALHAYQAACASGDEDACADGDRMSEPGYGAHLYIADSSPAPVGTTVVVNGNHNVVQVFGSAAKVVGTSTKKTAHPDAR